MSCRNCSVEILRMRFHCMIIISLSLCQCEASQRRTYALHAFFITSFHLWFRCLSLSLIHWRKGGWERAIRQLTQMRNDLRDVRLQASADIMMRVQMHRMINDDGWISCRWCRSSQRLNRGSDVQIPRTKLMIRPVKRSIEIRHKC